MSQPRLVGGRYELGELIGYGGMAEVHRGRDVRLGRDVAIKVLRADLARDPSFLNRFRREAQAAAGLNHPSIVSVYDTGEDVGPDGTSQPYIVMEFVEGRTLRDVLKAEGRLPARRVMEIGADICAALDFSHRNGIVHRDIKPANVMITPAGAVKVMDFGIARAVADNSATVTQTANVIGTAQYLSPEQARGESVDARSDVYSTGCLLYELATGVPPFQGDSPVAVAYQHVRENAPVPSARNPEVPRTLDSIVMKALAKNQLNRYQSAGDMRSDLQRALANQPVTAEAVMTDAERTQFIARTPVPPVALPHRDVDEPIDDGHHRRTGLLWLAIVIAMLVVIGGVVAVILVSKGQNNGKPKVAIPTGVVGEQPAQAKAQFTAAKLKLVPDPAGATTNGPCADGSTPSTEGVVCTLFQNSQPVHEGDQVVQNSTVYYQTYVQKKVSVPPVTGLSWNDAATQIHKLGLNPVKKAVNAGGTANQVVAQDPEQFTTVTPGSNVTLSVTTGKYRLPDVTGMKVADAENKLYGKFNNIDDTQTRVTSDQSKDQTVAEESPQPGKAYDPSTKITLIVYKFQQTTPTCSSGGSLPSGGASAPASGLPSGGTTGVPSTGSALPPCTTP
ncbi:MAG TPA: Stk1 family PASTA domain-containing Ser/Thr kinase [Jatrophihabitantaceae bacterium]|jgi:serine/threonine-protein kinase|nr:Stk1 family PASTA domain-containing Ser/Thr kinase [Jatrophihabitantaceae bacterium]